MLIDAIKNLSVFNLTKSNISWALGFQKYPPHRVKRSTVLHYARKFRIETFVETGTFYGEMVDKMKSHFDHIYSIELGDTLYENAVRKFARYPHIRIIHGDSGEKLPEILKEIDSPCLFWLDAHDSGGDTAKAEVDPIMKEIDCLLSHPFPHVILIDDARGFAVSGACPKTLDEYPSQEGIKEYVCRRNPNLKFSVKDDIIRIHP
jgi:hypothetical protein